MRTGDDHPNEQVYGGEELVAERYGIPVATLRTKRSRGGGPPYRKVGRRVLYRLEEVERWLDSHSVSPEAA